MAQQRPRDLIDMTVLSLLMEGDRHPYEINRVVRERRKDFATGNIRRLYRSVERLQQQGLIEPTEVMREGRRPERTVYRITEEGKAEFHLSLGEMLSIPASDYPAFTAAVALLAYLPVEVATQALHSRTALLEGEVAQHLARLTALKEHLHRLTLLEVEYLVAIRQAELDWVRSLLDDVRSGRLTWNTEELLRNPSLMLRPAKPPITVVREPDDEGHRAAEGRSP